MSSPSKPPVPSPAQTSPPSATPPVSSPAPTSPPAATPSAPPPFTNSTSPTPAPSSPPPAAPPISPPPPATPPTLPPPASPPSPPATPPASPPLSPPTTPPPSAPATPPVSSPPPPPASKPSPSPPPPSARSSPPSGKSPPPPPPPSSSSNSVSAPLVIGIAVAAVAFVVVLGLIYFCCWRKRRRALPPPSPSPSYGNLHGGQPQNWQHNAPPPADHIVKIPPQHPPPPFASHPPHPPAQFPFPPPPPPPPVVSSSGGSTSNDSGSEILVPPLSTGLAISNSKSIFTYEELAMATNGFSDANLLGQGGFGYVHKGTLSNGKEVAVKQLKSGSGQGEREFQAEVEIISRVHHRHLVTLVGYCISGDQRLLVYEYVPNKTLEFHLHGKGQPTMDWSTRLKIALGSAKGLAYLHEDCYPKIIHRDIKAANILLDFNFEAKVADFGLAKITSDNNTHISTRVMGSFGYIAPEYVSSGQLTDKSDVYSFGVMLLELITGKRAYDPIRTLTEDSLVEWARPLLTRAMEDGNYDAIVDPRLEKNYAPDEMSHMVACAATCVRHSARRRPRMSQIVRSLEGDVSLEDLSRGVRPGHSTVYGSRGSSEQDSSLYIEDMRKIMKLAVSNQEYTNSEYSAPTSEYGLNPSVSSSEGQQTHEMEMSKMKESQGFSSSS